MYNVLLTGPALGKRGRDGRGICIPAGGGILEYTQSSIEHNTEAYVSCGTLYPHPGFTAVATTAPAERQRIRLHNTLVVDLRAIHHYG